MIDGIKITIGGIELCNDVGSIDTVDAFAFPEDRPISYLMDGHLCAAFVKALDFVAGLHRLASVGSTDVIFDYSQAERALSHLRSMGEVDEAKLTTLESVVERWKKVPHSGLSVWWNRTPYAFDLLPIENTVTNQGISADAETESEALVAHVKTEDSICIVRADEVGKALIALHGSPKKNLQVQVSIEYVLMSAASLAEMEAFDRGGLLHCD